MLLVEEIRRAVEGLHDPAETLNARDRDFQPPRLSAFAEPLVRFDGSIEPNVIEVRAHDRPALLYSIARTITDCGLVIHGAQVDTLASDVIDVFFVSEVSGGSVTAERGEEVCSAILDSLGDPVGLP
jgi:[protein-PII] uridylyltransferase